MKNEENTDPDHEYWINDESFQGKNIGRPKAYSIIKKLITPTKRLSRNPRRGLMNQHVAGIPMWIQ
jgi:hypothetical protein